jgi:hypothetical protein
MREDLAILGCQIYFLFSFLLIKYVIPVTKAHEPIKTKNILIEKPAFLMKLASVVANL